MAVTVLPSHIPAIKTRFLRHALNLITDMLRNPAICGLVLGETGGYDGDTFRGFLIQEGRRLRRCPAAEIRLVVSDALPDPAG